MWHGETPYLGVTVNLSNVPNGGGSGIRTHDPLARIAVFKTAAFVRSAIPPVKPWVSLSLVAASGLALGLSFSGNGKPVGKGIPCLLFYHSPTTCLAVESPSRRSEWLKFGKLPARDCAATAAVCFDQTGQGRAIRLNRIRSRCAEWTGVCARVETGLCRRSVQLDTQIGRC